MARTAEQHRLRASQLRAALKSRQRAPHSSVVGHAPPPGGKQINVTSTGGSLNFAVTTAVSANSGGVNWLEPLIYKSIVNAMFDKQPLQCRNELVLERRRRIDLES